MGGLRGANMQQSKEYIQRLAWGTDAGFYRLIPQEVLHPANEADVQTIIARAHAENKHITFRAAGTSLSGQAISDSLLVVVGKKWENYEILPTVETPYMASQEDTTSRDSIHGVSSKALAIKLQPGIVGSRVNEILKPYGRRFTPDPASLKSAMVGGIVANNASGMCCGVHANSYRMLQSARLILADGTLLDTGDEASREAFRKSHPEFLARIEELRQRTLANPALVERIRTKYSIKNVTGLTILPFIEFEDPFDIIAHLLVGSEGTLAFMSEVTMATGEDYKHAASALLLFPDTDSCCRAITAMKHTGCLSAAEFFDRKAMHVVEDDFPELRNLPETATAALIKIETSTDEELKKRIAVIEDLLSSSPLMGGLRGAWDPALAPKYWAMRSGIFPAVGGTREIGTTCLIEDIAFPIDYLAEATTDLQKLFIEHNYPEAVIYGHALEGNYHFILNQRFDTPAAVEQYDKMMHAVVDLVVDKYHGSLKAEHGTGRNMAPFVRREWGDDAYQLMKDVKALFDPKNIFNPGVIFNEDESSYIQHIKPLPVVHPIVDRCIECGFCEVNCVACGFGLSSRQRIVVQREIARLRAAVETPYMASQRKENEALLKHLQKAFAYPGNELCAGDSLCSLSCPVGVNVGEYIHVLRNEQMGALGNSIGSFAANHFSTVGSGLSSVLTVAGWAHNILGDTLMSGICKGMHYCGIPLWTPAMPRRVNPRALRKVSPLHGGTEGGLRVVYFPSCLNQRLGLQKGSPATQPTMADMKELLEKAGYEVIFPENMEKMCCGTIWESKGMPELADQKGKELHEALLKASENGKYPILCDQSPCLYRMRHTNLEYRASNLELRLFEPAEFIEKFVLDKLDITPLDEVVFLHVTCSMRKMGLQTALERVAKRCAKTVIIPDEVGCCGFAGDKGFTHPELNEWALRKLRPQVEKAGATLGISNSRTCEIGLSHNSGIPYLNIAYLVNKASKARK